MPDTYRGSFQGPKAGSLYARQAASIFADNDIEQIAAFIAEPIIGCGGQVPLAPGYLRHLYPIIRSMGGVCISDEVQVGFGRLGAWFWGFEMHQVVPDIVILGKPIGNGHPIGAVVTTSEIAGSFNNGMEFFSSFGGNPVSCAIGEAVIKVIDQEGLQANAKNTGNYLKGRLSALKKQYESIGDVRGEGLFLGIDVIKKSKNPDAKLAHFIVNNLRNHHILTSLDGPGHNVIKIKPPLCFDSDNADELVEKIELCLNTRV